jgi:hypothetical protein
MASKEMVADVFSFDQIYGKVCDPFFRSLDDNRSFNSQYGLSNALKSGFAIYSLKAASLFQFQNMAQAEEHNLSSIYKIGEIPSDNGLRKILDGVDPTELRAGFKNLFSYTKNASLLSQYYGWKDYLVVAIDGVQHFQSKKVSCSHCLQRKHRDQTTSNYHCMLSAAIVCTGKSEVFPFDHEPIVRQDGRMKNDCERNALYRQIDYLKSTYSTQKMVLALDALYSCEPVIRRINEQKNWRYVINITEDGHKHLFEQFDAKNEAGKINWFDWVDGKESYRAGYINKVELNASSTETSVNMLYVVHKNSKGKETVFSYVTDIALSKRSVEKVLGIGRSRWKIENETFNTLKNQGYQFKHNFGHGHQHLCTVMAYLMMMAFWVDQLQQAASKLFQQVLLGIKTRISLWQNVRVVVKAFPMNSMKDVHLRIAEMYCIRLI